MRIDVIAAAILAQALAPPAAWRCELAYPDEPPRHQWDIRETAAGEIDVRDERGRTLPVQRLPGDAGMLRFALNTIRWDGWRLANNRPRRAAYTTGAVATLDRQALRLDVAGLVHDGEGRPLALAEIDALAAAEARWAASSGKPPPNSPMFFMLLRIAATPQSGRCQPLD